MSGRGKNLSQPGPSEVVRCLLVVPRGVPAPGELIEGLRGRGVEVHQASDAATALAALRQQSPRMVVLVELSTLTGLETLITALTVEFPQVAIWRYAPGEDDPLRPWAPPEAPPPPETPPGARPGALEQTGEAGAWYESVPLSSEETTALVEEGHASASAASIGMPSETAAQFDLADAKLAERLLAGSGDSLRESAMRLLRRRVGATDLRLIDRPGFGVGPRISPCIGGAAVEFQGQTFGHLTSQKLSPASLSAAADWLARWLTLDRRIAELFDIAHHDDLTGLWNRRYFERALDMILDEAERQRLRVTLMLYDIDDFKTYNDRYGHRAGDEILRETARLMRSVVRAQDVVARIGGDEFAVIFWEAEPPRQPNTEHPQSVRAAAERFQRAIREHRFPKLGREAPGRLTISGGLAGYPSDGRAPDQLIEHADRRLLESKSHGKNILTFGPGALGEQVQPV